MDNWATCDQMSPKVFGKHLTELLEKIRLWIASPEDVYGAVCHRDAGCVSIWMKLFGPEYPELVSGVRAEEYYVNMMIAWYFATALAKQYDAVAAVSGAEKIGKMDPQQDDTEGCGKLPDHAGAEGVSEDAENKVANKDTFF